MVGRRGRTRRQRRRRGGEIAGVGGFGCVMRQSYGRMGGALPCRHYVQEARDGYVSKVMFWSEAEYEVKEANAVKAVVDRVAKGSGEGIRGVLMADPPEWCNLDFSRLSGDVKTEILTSCGRLSEEIGKQCGSPAAPSRLTACLEKLINNNQLVALTMREGGVSIDEYADSGDKDIAAKARIIGKGLEQILTLGLGPLAKRGFVHMDVKAANVLVDPGRKYKCKLIDWGLAINTQPMRETQVTKELSTRSLMFNIPPSILIFRSKQTLGPGDADGIATRLASGVVGSESPSGHYQAMVALSEAVSDALRTPSARRGTLTDEEMAQFRDKPLAKTGWAYRILRRAVERTQKDGILSFQRTFLQEADPYGAVMCLLPFTRSSITRHVRDAACLALATYLVGESRGAKEATGALSTFRALVSAGAHRPAPGQRLIMR